MTHNLSFVSPTMPGLDRRLQPRIPVDSGRGAPIVFDGCAGFLHRAHGNTGVVLCGAWGYQDLCARSSWRMFAEQLAQAGFPCLRFEYPGTGNSLDRPDGASLAGWASITQEAATHLRRLTGVEDIVLAGIGHGAIVAIEACRAGLDAKGLALLAPVASGRRFVREMTTWSAFAALPSAGTTSSDPDATEIAGFPVPGAFARALRDFDLASLDRAPAPFAILALRDGGDDQKAAHALSALGVEVQTIAFKGYSDMMVSPTQSREPEVTIANLVAALREKFGGEVTPSVARVVKPDAAVLQGPDFLEQALRLGEDASIYGVLCRPSRLAAGTPIVLMLNAGRNAHTGWRRMNVDMARDLARAGIASLRFDLAGVAESPSSPGQPEQILYSDWPIRDVTAAIDTVRALGYGPMLLFGVCSGAYLALRVAKADTRVAGVIGANAYRLVWDPAETVDEALRFGNRRIGGAVSRLSHRRVLAILKGAEDIRPKLRLALKRAVRRVGVMSMGFAGRLSPRHALYAEFTALFDNLRARGAQVMLSYSPGDEGLNDYFDFFGRREHRLKLYPNVRRGLLPASDHNLTTPAAAHRLVDQITFVAAELMGISGGANLRSRACDSDVAANGSQNCVLGENAA